MYSQFDETPLKNKSVFGNVNNAQYKSLHTNLRPFKEVFRKGHHPVNFQDILGSKGDVFELLEKFPSGGASILNSSVQMYKDGIFITKIATTPEQPNLAFLFTPKVDIQNPEVRNNNAVNKTPGKTIATKKITALSGNMSMRFVGAASFLGGVGVTMFSYKAPLLFGNVEPQTSLFEEDDEAILSPKSKN